MLLMQSGNIHLLLRGKISKLLIAFLYPPLSDGSFAWSPAFQTSNTRFWVYSQTVHCFKYGSLFVVYSYSACASYEWLFHFLTQCRHACSASQLLVHLYLSTRWSRPIDKWYHSWTELTIDDVLNKKNVFPIKTESFLTCIITSLANNQMSTAETRSILCLVNYVFPHIQTTTVIPFTTYIDPFSENNELRAASAHHRRQIHSRSPQKSTPRSWPWWVDDIVTFSRQNMQAFSTLNIFPRGGIILHTNRTVRYSAISLFTIAYGIP